FPTGLRPKTAGAEPVAANRPSRSRRVQPAQGQAGHSCHACRRQCGTDVMTASSGCHSHVTTAGCPRGLARARKRRAARRPTRSLAPHSQRCRLGLLECGVSHGSAGIQLAEPGALTSLRLCLVGCAENAAQRDGAAVQPPAPVPERPAQTVRATGWHAISGGLPAAPTAAAGAWPARAGQRPRPARLTRRGRPRPLPASGLTLAQIRSPSFPGPLVQLPRSAGRARAAQRPSPRRVIRSWISVTRLRQPADRPRTLGPHRRGMRDTNPYRIRPGGSRPPQLGGSPGARHDARRRRGGGGWLRALALLTVAAVAGWFALVKGVEPRVAGAPAG